MKNILCKIWTFPQNILGCILVKLFKAKKIVVPYYLNSSCYIAQRFNSSWAGVSLGNYIIFSNNYSLSLNSFKHEYGHTIQSNKLGWFYLLIIGVPSFFGNLYDRIFHKNWNMAARVKWYYNQPWEKWADNLGGVVRS